jgi:hypothetical protein
MSAFSVATLFVVFLDIVLLVYACLAMHLIKGPDNPTRQLLPIMSTKCCSGDGEEGKTKEVVEDREVCERWCVKDGLVCVTKMVCDKDGV